MGEARRDSSRARLLVGSALVAVTIAALAVVGGRLRLDPNVGSLLPDQGEAIALRRYVEAFGGGDLGAVMVRSAAPESRKAPPGIRQREGGDAVCRARDRDSEPFLSPSPCQNRSLPSILTCDGHRASVEAIGANGRVCPGAPRSSVTFLSRAGAGRSQATFSVRRGGLGAIEGSRSGGGRRLWCRGR